MTRAILKAIVITLGVMVLIGINLLVALMAGTWAYKASGNLGLGWGVTIAVTFFYMTMAGVAIGMVAWLRSPEYRRRVNSTTDTE